MQVPTLFEWAGGESALLRLTTAFYEKVLADPLLEPVFREMSPEHPRRVAAFIGEVLGGPPAYSQAGGSHAGMVRHHLGRSLTEGHRRR